MKTAKIVMSVIIFIVIFYVTQSNLLVGIDRTPLTSLECGLTRVWVTFYIALCPAAFCAAIPYSPVILKKVLAEM